MGQENQRPEGGKTVKVQIAILGAKGVGKSSILCRLKNEEPPQTYTQTNGIDFRSKDQYKEAFLYADNDGSSQQGVELRMQFWDASGDRKHRALLNDKLKRCKAVIFVYDLNNSSSLKELETQWIPFALEHVERGTKFFLLGNKSDLVQKVVEKDGITLAHKYSMFHRKVSTKEEKSFEEIVNTISNKILGEMMPLPIKDIYVFMMLALDDDLDDDLIQDAMEILNHDKFEEEEEMNHEMQLPRRR